MAVKKNLTGKELKELLAKAVGGIYLGKRIDEFFMDFQVTDDALVLNYSKYHSMTIPINDEDLFINYAAAGSRKREQEREKWSGSTYFDYKFKILHAYISFNMEEKSKELSLIQFKEFVDNGSGAPNTLNTQAIYYVNSEHGGALAVCMSHCRLRIEMKYGLIIFSTQNSFSSVTINKEMIRSITNESSEEKKLTFLIEFNHRMPAMKIVPMIYMEDLHRNRLV